MIVTDCVSYSNRLVLTWEQIVKACNELEFLLMEGPLSKPSGIIPIMRGGATPGAMLAYALDIPIVDVVIPGQTVTYRPNWDLLIVDDICDTGKTIMRLRPHFPHARFATLYVKPQGKAVCDFVIHPFLVPVPQDSWVVFPWSPRDTPRAAKRECDL